MADRDAAEGGRGDHDAREGRLVPGPADAVESLSALA